MEISMNVKKINEITHAKSVAAFIVRVYQNSLNRKGLDNSGGKCSQMSQYNIWRYVHFIDRVTQIKNYDSFPLIKSRHSPWEMLSIYERIRPHCISRTRRVQLTSLAGNGEKWFGKNCIQCIGERKNANRNYKQPIIQNLLIKILMREQNKVKRKTLKFIFSYFQ